MVVSETSDDAVSQEKQTQVSETVESHKNPTAAPTESNQMIDLQVFETQANVSMHLMRTMVDSWIPKEYDSPSSSSKSAQQRQKSSKANSSTNSEPILYKSQQQSQSKSAHHQLRSKLVGNIPRKDGEELSAQQKKRNASAKYTSEVSKVAAITESSQIPVSSSSSKKRQGSVLDMYLNKNKKKKK